MSTTFRTDFVRFALEEGVLRFGSFVTKSGRVSPYFFNAGLFNTGRSVGRLADFYAQALEASGLGYDMLFGPAYKGIPLATATSVALASRSAARGGDLEVPFAYNRKEAKDHGEGGVLVGAPLAGKVVIIDDVITAGTSVRESVAMIRDAGAEPCAVLIAMDRMERAGSDDSLAPHSAVEEVQQRYGLPVISIASLEDILSVLAERGEMEAYRADVLAYRARYGVTV
ncbi:orotate phosphoribosyltransferase [Kerstersia gyiorum]|uniref:Orotate phosphoribosyltransferase n=1 Tax=Kerstersia gyiorum TaxID=206506 RepID=A0A171KWF1_9BURK|nr:orotate phosphoribosyltransferase [Kerstersia gyiorum]AZV94880.1 orotate phosphoribosyltransferase [Bordetella sp. J329]MCO7635762.1 orotate phosphoribosyltransferase [Pseudomonas sp. S 311-6]KAB0544986.1 orotate phosphoribosyltransferase [Kerstersia gyiorum]KKO73218.1 orotate phosphoribosyltransferase [Kerstersia gyiorum]MCP1632247.1 orotate phosphoribosyltransferase [Kerstersia gyiorum]